MVGDRRVLQLWCAVGLNPPSRSCAACTQRSAYLCLLACLAQGGAGAGGGVWPAVCRLRPAHAALAVVRAPPLAAQLALQRAQQASAACAAPGPSGSRRASHLAGRLDIAC